MYISFPQTKFVSDRQQQETESLIRDLIEKESNIKFNLLFNFI